MNYHLVYTVPGVGGKYVAESLVRKLGRKNGNRHSARLISWGGFMNWTPNTSYDPDQFLERLSENISSLTGVTDVVIHGPGLIMPDNFFNAYETLENQTRYYVIPASYTGNDSRKIVAKNSLFLNKVRAYKRVQNAVKLGYRDRENLSNLSTPFKEILSKFYQNLGELNLHFINFESWDLDGDNNLVVNSISGKPLRHSERSLKIAVV